MFYFILFYYTALYVPLYSILLYCIVFYSTVLHCFLTVPVVPNFLRRYDMEHAKEAKEIHTASLGNHTPSNNAIYSGINTPTIISPANLTCFQGLLSIDNRSSNDELSEKTVDTAVSSYKCLTNVPTSNRDMIDQKLRNESKETPLYRREEVRVGLLFASKAIVQLLTNPFIGPLTNR